MKKHLLVLVGAFIVLVAIILSVMTLERHTSMTDPDQARQDYQISLNRSEDRIPSNYVSVEDGTVYLALRKETGEPERNCPSKCATAAKHDDGSYTVQLPVGFVYQTGGYSLASNEDFVRARISKLTYWDPKESAQHTVTADKESVAVPGVLAYRQVSSLEVGESGFIEAINILETEDKGVLVLDFAEVASEPGHPLYDGNTNLVVPVTRTTDALLVCLDAPPVAYYETAPTEKVIPASIDCQS